ncbi:hypothetical protein Ciccas_007588, partial [Cichlidogyrus casuarinus]
HWFKTDQLGQITLDLVKQFTQETPHLKYEQILGCFEQIEEYHKTFMMVLFAFEPFNGTTYNREKMNDFLNGMYQYFWKDCYYKEQEITKRK